MSQTNAAALPTYEEVVTRVRRLVVDLAEADAENVTLDSRLNDDLAMDSLTQIELQMALEEAFGIEIAEERAAAVRTVGDAVRLVTQGLGLR